MAPARVGLIARAWYGWKALRLPWRKRFLAGYDLAGNTYWEFRLNSRGPPPENHDPSISIRGEPWRRIVHYPVSTPLSDVKVSPLWHQWLRHLRHDPPSVSEQRDDVLRQHRIKHLAAQADARWEAKPRLLDDDAAAAAAAAARRALPSKPTPSKQGADDARVGLNTRAPGEAWQPAAWSPPARNKAKQT
ncbi:hypothetical protein XA68_17193 [Ophiocordyceps unilateralis]|uniref:Uncharacterized protein n=1 Tax=Ophiocordyceps unilateralis TaxID=268505 RepID=A0A2A9P3L6_OPHUN|nr:hypothetical protein XA68_17193 [Ophiocordyceps unilateralis]